jgi:Ni/Co efflux regulator RcnB
MLKNHRSLLVLLVLMAVVWIATPGCAARISAGRGDDRSSVQRHAFDEGHRKGFDRGRDDAEHRRQRSYEQYKEYREGDSGYRRDDGDRDAYREAFRQGFRAGYMEAFNQRRDSDDRDRRR